ncbi:MULTISPECIES: helix-turn-helix transcriptional regulator [Vibrio]|uniref:helix-turn-helix transcriptional regulator n=1 Tax=Vibrio TaxID=662 RepID=UPI0014825A6D|nr:helix-turn-helix transcriptional regulator [Vibrio sp. F12]
MSNSALRNRLKLLIKSSSLSQSEIARRIGVTRGSVGHWLTNGNISRENLFALCKVLNVDISQVIDEDSYLNLEPLKVKVIQLTKDLPKEEYYKLEEVIKILDQPSE